MGGEHHTYLELVSGGNPSGIDYLVSVCAIFASHFNHCSNTKPEQIVLY